MPRSPESTNYYQREDEHCFELRAPRKLPDSLHLSVNPADIDIEAGITESVLILRAIEDWMKLSLHGHGIQRRGNTEHKK